MEDVQVRHNRRRQKCHLGSRGNLEVGPVVAVAEVQLGGHAVVVVVEGVAEVEIHVVDGIVKVVGIEVVIVKPKEEVAMMIVVPKVVPVITTVEEVEVATVIEEVEVATVTEEVEVAGTVDMDNSITKIKMLTLTEEGEAPEAPQEFRVVGPIPILDIENHPSIQRDLHCFVYQLILYHSLNNNNYEMRFL